MSDATVNHATGVYNEQGGLKMVIGSAAELEIVSGGKITNGGTQAANIADAVALTENSGAIGGTNDGDLPDLTTPDAAGNAAAVRELATAVNTLTTKLNAVIAVLEGAGLAASS